MKRHLWIPVLLALGGCQFWIAGHTKDDSMVVYGTGVADPMTGTTTYTLRDDDGTISCEGTSEPRRDGSQRAVTEIACDDGRTGKGETWLISADTGEGTGTDSCGNEYVMVFSTNKAYVDDKAETFREAVRTSGNAGADKCAGTATAPPHNDPLI